MLNKHGMKMNGLKMASGESKCLQGQYDPRYLELFYDLNTGNVWTVMQWSIGHNSWTEYHSREIIKIGDICYPCTMQEIADLVANRVSKVKAHWAWLDRERGI